MFVDSPDLGVALKEKVITDAQWSWMCSPSKRKETSTTQHERESASKKGVQGWKTTPPTRRRESITAQKKEAQGVQHHFLYSHNSNLVQN